MIFRTGKTIKFSSKSSLQNSGRKVISKKSNGILCEGNLSEDHQFPSEIQQLLGAQMISTH